MFVWPRIEPKEKGRLCLKAARIQTGTNSKRQGFTQACAYKGDPRRLLSSIMRSTRSVSIPCWFCASAPSPSLAHLSKVTALLPSASPTHTHTHTHTTIHTQSQRGLNTTRSPRAISKEATSNTRAGPLHAHTGRTSESSLCLDVDKSVCTHALTHSLTGTLKLTQGAYIGHCIRRQYPVAFSCE